MRIKGSLKSIGLFRALALGDLLCCVPVIRALRKSFPEAHIVLIGLDWATAFVKLFHRYIDELIVFPGYPGLPEKEPDVRAFPEFLKKVQEKKFDLMLQLQGDGTIVNNILPLFGATMMAGFHCARAFRPNGDLFLEYPEHGHEIERCLSLVSFLGIPLDGKHLDPFFSEADNEQLDLLLKEQEADGRTYVCIHPGARLPSRRWMPGNFSKVADALSGAGFTIVLTGSNDERKLTAEVQKEMSTPAVDLAGKTSLGVLAALFARARLLITNDTGASHVAASVSAPSVIIVTGSDPERWAPLDRDIHAIVHSAVPCRPCGFEVCPVGHPCAHGVTVETVLQTAFTLLNISSKEVLNASAAPAHVARPRQLSLLPELHSAHHLPSGK